VSRRPSWALRPPHLTNSRQTLAHLQRSATRGSIRWRARWLPTARRRVCPPKMRGVLRPHRRPPAMHGVLRPHRRPPAMHGVLRPHRRLPAMHGVLRLPRHPPEMHGELRPHRRLHRLAAMLGAHPLLPVATAHRRRLLLVATAHLQHPEHPAATHGGPRRVPLRLARLPPAKRGARLRKIPTQRGAQTPAMALRPKRAPWFPTVDKRWRRVAARR
jgi:hypothetical protein